jgi:UPF0042 nucleotide-binding protein
MKLVIISGLSGSGKTIALHTLEDMGYYCIDNLPVGLLDALSQEFSDHNTGKVDKVAVGIDARNQTNQIGHFPTLLASCNSRGIDYRTLFLQADSQTLLQRFSETRRKHPLSGPDMTLADAIEAERALLAPVAGEADLFIDTSRTNIHQLRELVRECIGGGESSGLSVVLRSFGFKHGIPVDADIVFDVRCLPNPHWEPGLRHQTGLDRDVIEFLDREPSVNELCDDIEKFLARWVPCYDKDNRSYLSVAIGCTGGQHRSVYLVERIVARLGDRFGNIVKRHRELE